MARNTVARVFLAFWPLLAPATVRISDDLSGAGSSYPWQAIGSACLTAGDGRGSIPSCRSVLGPGAAEDPVGQGALRLTDAGLQQSGAVISKFAFPSNEGLQVTFTALSYGGNALRGTGADGISFFLLDTARTPAIGPQTALGAPGGALGYSNSNVAGGPTTAGIRGGYIGLGIDEYGNFSNPNDNGRGGPGFRPNAIALRGAESIGYDYLSGIDVLGSIATASASSRSQAVPLTFDLSIGTGGLLNLSYSVSGGLASPVIVDHPIQQWNGRLPRNFYFGFAASTGDGTNIHEISCFKAEPSVVSGSSVGSNVLQSAKVQFGTQLFLARYHTQQWWGQVTSQTVQRDPHSHQLTINPLALWDANCALTGGYCEATQRMQTAQRPQDRVILTFDGAKGVAFREAQLSPAQRAALDSSAARPRVGYLRGERRAESRLSNGLRPRIGLLGDIIHASPVWVGAPRQPYGQPWADRLYPAQQAPEGSSYADFQQQHMRRPHVVYVGANDGMLHGFRSGASKADGHFDGAAPNDGRELLAYLPDAALRTLHSGVAQLDYSGQQYAHNAFVDATPGVGDVYYGGAWHSVLVGGLGGGGNAGGVLAGNGSLGSTVGSGSIYALDITQPDRFHEANAQVLVLGEWNAATLACVSDSAVVGVAVGVGASVGRCGEHLGNTYGTPVIGRLHNGKWAAIFGNGFSSRTGHAGVYIMELGDPIPRFHFLDTGAGDVRNPNGIAFVTPADLDGDHIIDMLYAGDLLGNLWRFDLSSDDPALWMPRAAPLLRSPQTPITSRVLAVPVHSHTGQMRLMLNFGSGRILPQTLTTSAEPELHEQSLFGVWDWDLSDWNQRAKTHFESLSVPSPQDNGRYSLNADQLQLQVLQTDLSAVNGAIHGVRAVASQKVCWSGSSECAAPRLNNQFGWRAALPEPQEQLIYSPVLHGEAVLFPTTIPGRAAPLRCSRETHSGGFTVALSPDQGMAPAAGYFDKAVRRQSGSRAVVGLGLSAVGSPAYLEADGAHYLVTQTSRGDPTMTQVNPGTMAPSKVKKVNRVTWSRLR